MYMIKKFLKKSDIVILIYQNILRIIYYFLGKLKFKLIRRDGILYLLDLSRVIDINIFLRGQWEKETILFMKGMVNSGDVVIEAGSNIGAHSFILAKLVGEEGEIFCFEPTNYAFARLRTNALLNDFTNMKLEKKILSDNKNTLSLATMLSDFHHQELYNLREDISEVPITSIDQYSIDFSRLDLIKIDVDGYDYRVLIGASMAIKKFRPKVMIELAEFTLKSAGDSIQNILNFFFQNKYDGFYIIDNSKIRDFNEVIARSQNGNSHIDAYFIPKK